MDKLTAMRAFTRVVESGSFVGAARLLDLSTAAVSRLINQLEDDLGVRLLQRTTRRITQTDAGRAYYLDCTRILGEVHEAEAAIGHDAFVAKGKLRVTLPQLPDGLIESVLYGYRTACPEVTLEVTLLNRMFGFPAEGYDVAIHVGRSPSDAMVVRKLSPLKHYICAAPIYLERHGTPLRPEDLAHHNCLTSTYSEPSQLNSWTFENASGASTQIFLHGDFHSNNGELLRKFALHGEGIIRLPSYMIHKDVNSGTLVPLLQDWAIPAMGMYAIYPSTRHISAKVRVFIDILQKQLIHIE